MEKTMSTARAPLPDARPRHILFIFLDGVGVGLPDRAINPLAHLTRGIFPQFLAAEGSDEVRLEPPSGDWHSRAAEGFHGAVDACLGVPGTPQSATGQAALFTGVNAAAALGHHLMAFPNDAVAA